LFSPPENFYTLLVSNWLSFNTTRVANKKQNTYFVVKENSMNTKLTLTIEKEVIEIAKKYAKEKEQSLSEMVENYFKFVTAKRLKINEKQLSPKIRKLRGIIKTDDSFNYKQILTEELSKKYGV